MSPTGGGVLGRLLRAAALAWSASPGGLLVVVAVTAAQGIGPVLLAWLTKLLLDDIAAGAAGFAWWTLAALLGTVAAAALLSPVNQHCQNVLRRGVEVTVQSRLFGAVNAIPGLRPFEQPQFHDRLSLAEQAGQMAPGQVVRGVTGLVQSSILVAGFTATLIAIDWRFALVATAVGLPALLAELAHSRSRARLAWRLSPLRRHAIHYSMLQGDLQAVKEIRLYGLADLLLGRMVDLLRRASGEERAVDRRALRLQAAVALVGMAALAAGMVAVLGAAWRGGLGVGTVALLLAALPAVQSGLTMAAAHVAETHHAMLLFGHYEEITGARAAAPVGDMPGSSPVPALRGAVELRDVWFRYGPDQPWVLRGVDLTIPYGQTVALIGVNGAGKSTIVKLLGRFYDPERGSVCWDGLDLRDADPVQLRRRLSAVFQDFMLYDLSAAENVGVGDVARLSDRAAIRDAAVLAGVDGVLTRLPQGYDTMLSRVFAADNDQPGDASGVLLSGGQRQRIAVARALLRRHSDLLILDEPTSGLDAAAEQQLHQELKELRRGRTTVLISHRLSTVREADHIVVLDGGRVAEQGTHIELISHRGVYADLFERQAAGYRTELDPVADSEPYVSASSAHAGRLPI